MTSVRWLAAMVTMSIILFQPESASAQAIAPDRAYTILIYEQPADLARRSNPKQSASYWQAYNQFAGALAEAGVLRGGSALSETSAVTVRGNGSADAGVPGARLGGYVVIEAASLAEAQRFAAMAPAFALSVEVRPHRENPTMAKVPDGD